MNNLGVNIDHVATVRQARKTDEPDPVWAAVEAELGGADLITFHLREDRRHINDRDAEVLRRTVATRLNMEMAISDEIVDFAIRLKPHKCTLVPERREEVTTEGGLDVVKLKKRVAPVVARLKNAGIIVSAFIEPLEAQVTAAAECKCDEVELWTGGYANAPHHSAAEMLDQLAEPATQAHQAGLLANAGHGLTYRNIAPIARIGLFEEFHIGHSIVARAMLTGMRAAVREMKDILDRCRQEVLIMSSALGDAHSEAEE